MVRKEKRATTPHALYPLLFTPVYKHYLWGGNRIARTFHRVIPRAACAESWELADRTDGMSIVANGPLAGRDLRTLVKQYGPELLGRHVRAKAFPLLIKLIDARQRLSLQVHPDATSAGATGGEPKTEMWYVLDAKKGSRVFSGFRDETGKAQLLAALQRDAVEPLLRQVPIKAGDAIFIPGGRVHAIDAGCLLLEIQQNSNTTFRLYDWRRVGHDGKPRELHLGQALQTIRWNDRLPARTRPSRLIARGVNSRQAILRCPFFQVERLRLRGSLPVRNDGASFHVLFVVEGRARIQGHTTTVNGVAGTACLLPAALARYRITPVSASALVLRIRLPPAGR